MQPPGSSDSFDGTDLLIPRGVSGWSLAGCYLGVLGLLLPFVGLLFALPALACSIIALRRRRQNAGSYGSVTSDVRAVIGLVLGGLGTLLWGGIMLMLLLSSGTR